ncbi:MAG: protein kinase domain-containing protein, partial [Gemmataceae bacterium]
MTDETIFAGALEKADPAERAAFLIEVCGDDTERRKRLVGLLAAHAGAADFLERPAVAPQSPDNRDTCTVDHNGGTPADGDEVPLAFLAPATRPDSLGRIGHYEVLQLLGQGGFGIVFRAFDDMLHRVVAVKVLSPQLAATSPARKRFLREAQSSAQVRHENVVQTYEIGEQPLPYIAMEFIPGETLQQKLDRVGPLDVLETLRIGRQIAEGLAAAHATDLIHRDIKPGNVLLEGGQKKVKITDFGLARTADDASISQSGIIAGTPMYMAPEQARGETLDQRADLFSLGSVLYQMAAGRPPFRANTTVAVLKRVAEDKPRAIHEIIPETPQWLCDIIAKLHAKNPDDRYQSAREVADVLADCEAQLKTNAQVKDFSRIPPSKPAAGQPERRAAWRKPAGFAAAALLLPVLALALTEITGVTHLFRHREETPITKLDPPKNDDSPILPVADKSGWDQLFNGKDLDGWIAPAPGKGHWHVERGQLVGRGPASYLFTQRADFADFHLRAEVSTNADADCGIFLRSGLMLPHGKFPAGYVAIIANGQHAGPGTLLMTVAKNDYAISAVRVAPVSVPAGTFLTVDMIARGKRLLVKINDQQVAEYTDEKATHVKGRIALQAYTPNTVVRFRKLRIKELPPAAASCTDADIKR